MAAVSPFGATAGDGAAAAGVPLVAGVPGVPRVPGSPGVPRSVGPSVPRPGVTVAEVAGEPRSGPKPADAMAVAVARPRVMVMLAPWTSPRRLVAVLIWVTAEAGNRLVSAGGRSRVGLTAAGREKVTWRPPLVMVSAGARRPSLLARGPISRASTPTATS